MEKVDYFDRQKRIPNWNQEIVSNQVCLCLGCGGLGCTVTLVRLGVKKIYIVDKDVVDYHNLNRQVTSSHELKSYYLILFSKDDIGRKKVEAAHDSLQKHNINTEIVPLHLEHWDKIVEVSKDCTVVFNMIDVGDYLDYAVQSLALKRGIPFSMGGTFRTTLTADFFGPKGKPCWSCVSDVKDKKVAERLAVDKITEYSTLDFVPKDNNPTGASNVYVCCTCCNFMVSMFIQYLTLKEAKLPSRLIFYFETYDIDKWAMEASKDCPLCSNLS